MSIVVGLDLSLTSTGWVRISTAPHPDGISRDLIKSSGHRGDTLAQRTARLARLCERIVELACDADLIVIEGPSLGQARQGGTHDRSGLWWLVVATLSNCSGLVVEAPPACRARYATGKGNASKDQVLAAVVRRYPDVPIVGNDDADALVLAAMGARYLGEPIEDSLPQAHLAAMAGVTWPTSVQTTLA